jgi:hypothetical protein
MGDALTDAQFWARQVEKASNQADQLRSAIERAIAQYDAGCPADCRETLEAALSVDDDLMHVKRIQRPGRA